MASWRPRIQILENSLLAMKKSNCVHIATRTSSINKNSLNWVWEDNELNPTSTKSEKMYEYSDINQTCEKKKKKIKPHYENIFCIKFHINSGID